MKHTILGAGGTIGTELARNLHDRGYAVRQVGRNPKAVNSGDELVRGDLLNAAEIRAAVKGSDVVYLTAGLPYLIKVWQEQWPVVMRNTIDACKAEGARLVFFDNVYAYGKVVGPMTESTPFNPCSKKGEVRAKIATMLLEEISAGNLNGMIVRSADFYGPGVLLSMIDSTVTKRLQQGKAPQWIGDPARLHSFTFTPDAGKCLAILGTDNAAFNQTWHALTSAETLTGLEYIRIASEALGIPVKKPAVMGKSLLTLLGLFIPVLKEFREMYYQFNDDYRFDSGKFMTYYQVQPTPYAQGIAATTLYRG